MASNATIQGISEESAYQLKSEFGFVSNPLERIMVRSLQEGKMYHLFSEGRNSKWGD